MMATYTRVDDRPEVKSVITLSREDSLKFGKWIRDNFEQTEKVKLTPEEIENLNDDVFCCKELMDPAAWFDVLIENIEKLINKYRVGDFNE
jgi:hypothetical protein